jgi:two-component system, sensor histidine kinase
MSARSDHYRPSINDLEHTLLNVDDNDGGRYAKTRILTLAGYKVIEAATGAEALRLVKEAQPQLVLLDVKLPDATGLDVCRAIKTDPVTANTMVLQISAIYVSGADRAMGLECGADTYLVEPVDKAELLATVKALIRLYDRERELREADRQKNEFLAALGHELRNPLGVLSNAFDLLAPSETPESREIRDIIKRQINRMNRLSDDLLDIARLARGQIALQKEPCDFAAIVRDTVEDYRGMFDAGGLRLELVMPTQTALLAGDCTRLAQSVSNVLHNAHKFTEPGGTVTVRLELDRSQQRALLRVRDTGIGMDEETLAHVFEPFSQASATLDQKRTGLGLGLALVRAFIESHGGEVSAASRGPGQGSEFTIRLPLDPTLAKTKPAAENADPSEITRSYRILIIDDNRLGARALQMFLSKDGHQVEMAFTGPAGVEAARRFRPEVVLCDIALPGLDGFGVAQCLRQELEKLYLIAVSGYGRDEDQERAQQAGFDAYLTKPLDFRDLEKLLAEFIRKTDNP